MLGQEEIVSRLEENRKKIRDLGVKRIALIGSYARNEEKQESDIDFLVEFEEGRGLFRDYSGLLNFLKDLFKKEIDIVKPHLIREELKPYILGGKQVEAEI